MSNFYQILKEVFMYHSFINTSFLYKGNGHKTGLINYNSMI